MRKPSLLEDESKPEGRARVVVEPNQRPLPLNIAPCTSAEHGVWADTMNSRGNEAAGGGRISIMHAQPTQVTYPLTHLPTYHLPTYQSTQASCTRTACKLRARTHARRRRRRRRPPPAGRQPPSPSQSPSPSPCFRRLKRTLMR